MKCTTPDIKELLPLYLERELDEARRKRVDAHLSGCEDCRGDLSLLQALSGEAVPDPGEDFWAEMPRRIRREIRAIDAGRSGPGIRRFLEQVRFPAWSWGMATAAAAMLAVSLLILKPAPHPISSENQAEEAAAYVQSAGRVELTELDQTELNDVSEWTDRELAAVDEEIIDGLVNIQRKDIHEELSELDYQDTQKLSDKLQKEETEEEA